MEVYMKLPVLNNTTVDLDEGKYETLQTSTTAQTSGAVNAGTVLIVASGADVLVDVGPTPDCTAQFAVVPVGPTGVQVWLTNPGVDKVSVRTVSGTGYVTLYAV
jgi:hypothetical protein